MVEKVVKTNFFHHFREKKIFLRNSWKKWKQLSWPTFSTTQAVLEAQIVEKVGVDNPFPLFPRISEEVFGIIKMVEKVVQDHFFHHFREKKLPQKFVEKVEKVLKTNFFHDSSLFGGPNRGKSWF